MRFRLRMRPLLLMTVAFLVGASEPVSPGATLAYFTSTAVSAANTISTVSLGMTAPNSSEIFNITSNMIPGDYQVKLIDIRNTGVAAVPQQDFTYSVANTNAASGDQCSLLDSSPPCGSANPPNATATTGAAFLLLRCTSDSPGTVLAACASDVYVTQVYPTAGAGTQVHMAGGLSITPPATTVTSNVINLNGQNFTGGQLLIGSPFGMGGTDAVAGSDLQLKGVLSANTDHLAAVVYLPSTAGNTLADKASTLTFTWVANQRLGGVR